MYNPDVAGGLFNPVANQAMLNTVGPTVLGLSMPPVAVAVGAAYADKAAQSFSQGQKLQGSLDTLQAVGYIVGGLGGGVRFGATGRGGPAVTLDDAAAGLPGEELTASTAEVSSASTGVPRTAAAGGTLTPLTSGLAAKLIQLQKNAAVGASFEVNRAAYEEAGFAIEDLRSDVGVTTPWGMRYPDVAVYYKGTLVEYIELKSSQTATYGFWQEVKDEWIRVSGGPTTSVVRPDAFRRP